MITKLFDIGENNAYRGYTIFNNCTVAATPIYHEPYIVEGKKIIRPRCTFDIIEYDDHKKCKGKFKISSWAHMAKTIREVVDKLDILQILAAPHTWKGKIALPDGTFIKDKSGKDLLVDKIGFTMVNFVLIGGVKVVYEDPGMPKDTLVKSWIVQQEGNGVFAGWHNLAGTVRFNKEEAVQCYTECIRDGYSSMYDTDNYRLKVYYEIERR